jgi:hypothetical protein
MPELHLTTRTISPAQMTLLGPDEVCGSSSSADRRSRTGNRTSDFLDCVDGGGVHLTGGSVRFEDSVKNEDS